MPILTIYNLGQGGVNVDASDLHMKDEEVRLAQNIIADPLGTRGGLKNRPGLIKFNSSAAVGSVLGGTAVPLTNLLSADSFLYIGRGPIS